LPPLTYHGSLITLSGKRGITVRHCLHSIENGR
jgi:hypothetical protein